MRLVIVTSADDALGGVFAQAYYAAGGFVPSAVFVMEGRDDLSYPPWAFPWVSLRLFGVLGMVRIASARYAGRPLHSPDRDIGLHRGWLDTLAGADVPRVACRNLNDPSAFAALTDLAPDVLVSIGAPRIIRPEALAAARLGAANVHNGSLPRYRGHFATFWEIVYHEQVAGVSIHEMTACVDAGRMLAAEQLPLADARSFLDLLLEKKRRGGRLLAHLLHATERRGAFPESPLLHGSAALRESEKPGYFGWPSLADVGRFDFRSARRGARRARHEHLPTQAANPSVDALP